MALARKFLVALGIEPEKIDEIIDAHTETVNALKEERDKYKKDADALPAVQKELDDLKKAADQNPDAAYKQQYEDLKAEYDKYKADVEAKAVKAQKTELYKKLLKDAKVSEKRIDTILRVSDVDGLELDKDGDVKDADAVKKKIAEEWADFIVAEGAQGAPTPTPPKGEGGGTPGTPSRAAELAAKYRANLYGGDKA
jgi:hypothetical protein